MLPEFEGGAVVDPAMRLLPFELIESLVEG
jgi:hypothetical protein